MLPQITVNLRVSDKSAVRQNDAVRESVNGVAERLGRTGRVLLRESGTEPVVRVMVEAPTKEICEQYANEIADKIRSLGLA